MRVTVNARYYFGQPVASGRVAWVVHRQPYYSPLRWSDEDGGEEGGGYWYGEEQALEGTARLDANGKAEITVPVDVDEQGNDYSLRIEARVTDASSREVSGNDGGQRDVRHVPARVDREHYVIRPGAPTTLTHPRGGLPRQRRSRTSTVTSLSARRIPDGYWTDTDGTRARDDGRRSRPTPTGAPRGRSLAPNAPGDYRIRVPAPSRRPRGSTTTASSGCRAAVQSTRDDYGRRPLISS